MDSSCTKPFDDRGGEIGPPFPGPPPQAKSYPLAGQPPSGYWYWGYDFQTLDAAQGDSPRFVNRSNKELTLKLSFTIPRGACGGGCLPGVEFYFDQDVHKRDPKLVVSGTSATATVPVKAGDRYAFVIGLWQATNPVVSVSDASGYDVAPDEIGMSARPDVSVLLQGSVTICQCRDNSSAACYRGDHYSNGLSGGWTQTLGRYGLNAWSNCPQGGTG
jgi:hypothetical protein